MAALKKWLPRLPGVLRVDPQFCSGMACRGAPGQTGPSPERRAAWFSSSGDAVAAIKDVRFRTGAPMKSVKAALEKCNWDIGQKSANAKYLCCFGISRRSSGSVVWGSRFCVPDFLRVGDECRDRSLLHRLLNVIAAAFLPLVQF